MASNLVSVSQESFEAPCTSKMDSERQGKIELDRGTIKRAAGLILEGQVVAMPTETVYGLAANALDQESVSSIYKIKGRPSDNPLIIHVSSLAMLESLYEPGWKIPTSYAAAVAALWPGPLTILLPRSNKVAPAVTCGLDTMAVRMPSHRVALALIEACGVPLAAPSANSSGRPSPTTAPHVMDDLFGNESSAREHQPALVIDGGPCSCGVESTVLDAFTRSPAAILRPGGATFEQLSLLTGLEGLIVYVQGSDKGLEASPSTPGMKYKHYSPTALVILVEQSVDAMDLRHRSESQVNHLISDPNFCGKVALIRTTNGDKVGSSFIKSDRVVEISLGGSPSDVARGLFAALRQSDTIGVEAIVVEGVTEEREGMAVMNRLRKAASVIC